jgi:hypothetical protein
LIPRRARDCPVLQSICIYPAARVKQSRPEHSPPPGAEVTNEWTCISTHPSAFMAVYRDKLILPNSEEEEEEEEGKLNCIKLFIHSDIKIILTLRSKHFSLLGV